MQNMTPRQVREQIDAIDQDLNKLEPWEKKLVAMRKQYVLTNDRHVVNVIENGLERGHGRPALADLEPFDDGWPGLREARETIAELKERRALLVEQQPSKAETAERVREAESLAADIRKRAKALTAPTAAAHSAVNDAARLCLIIADETWRLWEANTPLDRLTAAADITRPETPSPSAPTFPLAASASLLLRAYFRGAQPSPIDSSVVPDIRTSLAESEQAVSTT